MGERKKKTILVPVRMDLKDRLLLNWALVEVAKPGDHVIVLHVCTGGGSEISMEENPSLDSYLRGYKGLCILKQLEISGQVSRGDKVKKVLVREAKLCDAAVVVVGINRRNAFGGWLATAWYCAKKLPATTEILAVTKGKVVYRRSNQSQGAKINPKTTLYPIPSLSLKESSHYSVSERSEDENSSPHTVDDSNDEPMHTSLSRASSSSISSSVDTKQDNSSLAHEEKDDASSKSLIAGVATQLSQLKPHAPFLKGATSAIAESVKESKSRKMSVVHWVISLPNRITSHMHRTRFDSISYTSDSSFELSGEKNSIKRSFSAWGELPKELEFLIRTKSSSCEWFSHEELRQATSQFSSENLIGTGGYSSVYKGYLTNGKLVAVKVLTMTKEAWNDFVLEIDINSSLKHKHITSLVGICLDDDELILVYDFMSMGNLEENLQGRKHKSGLSWEARFNVAVGTAEAITYLHKECSPSVIHRDIKSSNILLSEELEPHLCDFGLAMRTSSHEAYSDVVGTFGYLAPEYFMYGRVSDKLDVYSFGVVLLELLSGRKPISSELPKGQESLVMWAKPILEKGDIMSILDPNLAGNFNEDQMRRMVHAVTLSITMTSRLRPEMKQILELLRGETNIEDLDEWVNSRMNEPEESAYQDGDEAYPDCSTEQPLDVALLDEEDTATSFSTGEIEQPSRH